MRTFLYSGLTALFIALVCSANLVQGACYGGACNTDDDCPKSMRRLQMPQICLAACIDGTCQKDRFLSFEGDAANSTAETALSAAAKESFSVLSVLLFFVGMWI